ncbi:hypothetical protein [Palleronia sp. LCG004]|uniref:hypothetical protein n=1 Tax=Palleronia sp. LCG004 TaxID=3079304 RepID=UPI0029423166|nr:hypothetical protein [Palleronia sp. LCG004]WOI57884.1 hypothetical protein RVY76_14840 [Palleronia sp. LCG004]
MVLSARDAVRTDTALFWALRNELDLKGSWYGNGAGMCGTWTVHIDGQATFACQMAIEGLADSEITTIESL